METETRDSSFWSFAYQVIGKSFSSASGSKERIWAWCLAGAGVLTWAGWGINSLPWVAWGIENLWIAPAIWTALFVVYLFYHAWICWSDAKNEAWAIEDELADLKGPSPATCIHDFIACTIRLEGMLVQMQDGSIKRALETDYETLHNDVLAFTKVYKTDHLTLVNAVFNKFRPQNQNDLYISTNGAVLLELKAMFEGWLSRRN